MDTNTLHKPPIHFKDMSWFNRCIVFCGVGFGSGLAPKAPGTFGSAFALLFVPIWLSFGFTLSLIAILIMSVVGIYICGQTAKSLMFMMMDELFGMNLQDNQLLFCL
ncbi:phosphatidylglycerophosphatase A [Acinetobacter baumannii]|nr:phosphatidylglycerophosphatase A [Acinetobacter baumannii]